MIHTVTREPYLKRRPTVIDRTYGIQAYDIDNLYPQRAEEVRDGSYTASSCCGAIAEFIDGEGFADPALANLVFNTEGNTGNDVLEFIAQDKGTFRGFALHFKYNPFTYRIMEVTPVEFKYCRLGLPDSNGNVTDIKYCTNWERDPSKVVGQVFEIFTYPVFNPNPEAVKAQIEEYGWEEYPGQILYWTPKPYVYPKCVFDPVFNQAQSQDEIGVYELSSIQNNFGVEKLFRYPGRFEDETEKNKFKRELNGYKGAHGTKSTMVVEDPDGENRPLIENIQMQNTDKMFEFTSKNGKNAIRESMALPAEVIGQLPDSGMFNKQQIQDAYEYVNAKTSNHRNQISRVFKKIMAFWKDAITISSFEIIPQQYGVTGATTPAQPCAQPGQAKAEFNEVLAGLSGKQDQNLRRIQRKYDKGELSIKRAIAELKMKFGVTDEQALSLLDDDPNNDAV